MRLYRFEVDGRAAGPLRAEWHDAAQDAVDNGMGVWVVRKQSVKLSENLGAAIARIDKEEPEVKRGPDLRTD